MDNKTEIRIHELVFKSVEGIITEQECRELESIVAGDIQARNIYTKCITLNLKMLSINDEYSGSSDLTLIIADQNELDSCDDSSIDVCNEVLGVLREEESTSPAVDVIKEKVCPDIKTEIEKAASSQTHLFYRIYNTLVSVAAVLMFLFIVYANIFPPQYSVPVATVTDQLDVIWNADSRKLGNNDRILTNQPPYRIEKGIVKIIYDQGVDVLIEGPAEFEIDRAGIFLKHGRLFSSVSDTGLGFAVDSPYARFIDLGTEFVVEVDSKGSSQLHVIDGEVQFYAGITGKGKISRTVLENSAISFDSLSGNVGTVLFKGQEYARQINSETGIIWRGEKQFNLADIIGGGNGFGTGKTNTGINNLGEFTILDNIAAQKKVNRYLQMKDSLFIDSIFVPNGPTKIDSNGTVFSGFETSNDRFYLGILNGAWHQHKDSSVPRHALRLEGNEYGSRENPAIYIHANQGITFDLDAIRNYTNMDIRGFVSSCGLSDSYGDYTEEILKVRKRVIKEPKASFYVLVDGQERFVQKDTTYLDEPVEITVVISPDDRYLTLATTQGSDSGNEGDWTLFAVPVLELSK